MSELHTTGVPFPFECVIAVELADNQEAAQLEKALHKAFESERVNPNRGFFEIKEENVVAILEIWPGGKDVTTRAQDEELKGTQAERDAIQRSKRRRQNLDFAALGIQPGQRLMFTGPNANTEILEAEVVDNKKVRFREEVMSLAKATNRCLERPDQASIRGALHWSCNGQKLDERYNEFHGPA